MKRLRDAFPDLYRLMYAEERAARGLVAVPLTPEHFNAEAHERAMAAAGVTFDYEAVLTALHDHGIED